MHKHDIYNSSKNVDTFKLLLSDPDFIKLIDDFREKEKISEYKEPVDWMVKNEEDFYDWVKSDEYKNEIKKIKDDYENKKINILERKKLFKELDKKSPLNKVNIFCTDIIERFNLPYNFSHHINSYLFTKNSNNPFLGAGVFFEEIHQNRDKKEKILSINIYQNPSEEDFEVLKRFIKRRTKNFPKYKQIKDLENRLDLESAYDNKDAYRELEGEESNNKLIAKDFMGDPNKNKKVVDDVNAIKKLRKKTFKKDSSEKTPGK